MGRKRKGDEGNDTEEIAAPREVPDSLVDAFRSTMFKTSQGVRGSWADHAVNSVKTVGKAVNEFSNRSIEQEGKQVSAKVMEETKSTVINLKELRKELAQVASRPAAMIIAMRKRDQIKSTMPPHIEILLNKLMLAILDETIKEHDVQNSQENKDV